MYGARNQDNGFPCGLRQGGPREALGRAGCVGIPIECELDVHILLYKYVIL